MEYINDNNLDLVIEDIAKCICDIYDEDLLIYDLGDKNIFLDKLQKEIKDYYNFLNYSITKIGKEYGMEILEENGYVPIIREITDKDINDLKKLINKDFIEEKEQSKKNSFRIKNDNEFER